VLSAKQEKIEAKAFIEKERTEIVGMTGAEMTEENG
jgi:hypothetical protein